MSSPLLWYANRGTGMVLLTLLTLTAALGVLSTARAGGVRWPRFVTQGLHRNVSLLTVALLGVHILTAVTDSYVDIRWYEAFLPRAGGYAGGWLWLGILGSDLIVAITVTSLVRYRLPHRTWRGLHLFAYLSWGVGVLHGIGIGTDSGTGWGMATAAGSVGVVVAAAVVRLATVGHERSIA
jgi:methionine sulfoxide reductase heme-binding subunit